MTTRFAASAPDELVRRRNSRQRTLAANPATREAFYAACDQRTGASAMRSETTRVGSRDDSGPPPGKRRLDAVVDA